MYANVLTSIGGDAAQDVSAGDQMSVNLAQQPIVGFDALKGIWQGGAVENVVL